MMMGLRQAWEIAKQRAEVCACALAQGLEAVPDVLLKGSAVGVRAGQRESGTAQQDAKPGETPS